MTDPGTKEDGQAQLPDLHILLSNVPVLNAQKLGIDTQDRTLLSTLTA